MVKIDLEKVMGIGDREENSSLLSTKKSVWNPSQLWNSRPSKKTIWWFVGLVVLLQGLVCWKLFFRSEPMYIGPPYNVTETVELVTAYYELLRDMRYIGQDMIAYPPHDGNNAINITLATELGLDQAAIDTLLQLPYIIVPHEDSHDETMGKSETAHGLANLHARESSRTGWMSQDRDIFWRNGHFIDYRDDRSFLFSRDPLKRWEISSIQGTTFEQAMLEFEPLPKSAIPLSTIRSRRYGLVLVLDTATNRIIVLDTQGGSRGSDPFFNGLDWNKWPLQYKIHNTEFYGEEVYARPAPDLLRDFIRLTSDLQSGYVPGSVRTDERYTPELSPPKWEKWVQDLYRDYGWPAAESLQECQFLNLRRNNTCDHNPMDSFKAGPFDKAMSSLLHNITVRYMPDWYCPVPRREDYLTRLKNNKGLTEEQIAYAESDEPEIPLNLESWGGNLVFMQT